MVCVGSILRVSVATLIGKVGLCGKARMSKREWRFGYSEAYLARPLSPNKPPPLLVRSDSGRYSAGKGSALLFPFSMTMK